jgi:hypothetical protein
MEQEMCGENKNEKKTKAFSCCDCDGITEMMKDCFPDDAGFTACLSRMNGDWQKVCGRKVRNAFSKNR